MGKASRRKREQRQGGRAVGTIRARRNTPGTTEARVVIAGKDSEGNPSQEAVGLVLDPETDEVIGAIPGTPAADDLHGVAASHGYKVAKRTPINVSGYSVPDDLGDNHMEPLPLPKGMRVSTTTLMHLSALARQLPWCTRALDDSAISSLDPTGWHIISAAYRHTTSDWKRDNVRCRILLKHRGVAEPDTRMIDLPSRQFGILLSTHLRADTTRHAAERLLPGAHDILEQPNWAAGRSFPKVWEECQFRYRLLGMLQVYGDSLAHELHASGSNDAESARQAAILAAKPQTMLSAATLNALSAARLIVAEPEWVQGIDDDRPGLEELWAYAQKVPLPFDTIYLDFEGPGGLMPTVPITIVSEADGSKKESAMRLAGCVMWREGDELHIVPLAWPMDWPTYRTSAATGAQSMYQPLGKVVLNGTTPPTVGGVGRAVIAIDGLTTNIETTVLRADHVANLWQTDETRVDIDGRVEVPIEPEEDASSAMGVAMGALVIGAAARALRVLYMLQASNVELVEAKLHREGKRRLKRADKRGWPMDIGLMVAVRWRKRLYFRPPDFESLAEGEGRGYSHAFWVTGHPKYFPLGTRMADALAEADPTKLIDHPQKGLCRMVWTPPFIKGLRDPDTDAEREPVEKVRKVVGDPYEETSAA